MKLTKQKLINRIKQSLSDLGYIEFKDSVTGAQGLFVKKTKNNLYLSLGTIISRHEDTQFSASFYLSKTTRWGSVWDDIPKESYRRISSFLFEDERMEFLDDEHHIGNDAWWDESNDDAVENFLEVVKIAEDRIVKDADLIKQIEMSNELDFLSCMANNTIEIAKSNLSNEQFLFQPKKEIDKIPLLWFKASERVLRKNDDLINKNLVKHLASDAWRQHILNK